MTIDLSQLSLTVSAAALIGVLAGVIRGSMRFAALELKVDTMWSFQMRRALSEVVGSGIGTLNSPLHFTREAIAALEPIKGELVAFWRTLAAGIGDADALLKIEARFGDALLQHVCIPCGLSHGACLLLALTIAKESIDVQLA